VRLRVGDESEAEVMLAERLIERNVVERRDAAELRLLRAV
jgi:hypothetical protein